MNTHPLRVPRMGAPEPASTNQREVVLELLRAAGKAGINRDCFLMGSGPCSGHRMTQVGARLDELEEEGFVFESFKAAEHDRFVTYRLVSEPVVRAERYKRSRRKFLGNSIADAVAALPAALALERHVEAFQRVVGGLTEADLPAVDNALARVFGGAFDNQVEFKGFHPVSLPDDYKVDHVDAARLVGSSCMSDDALVSVNGKIVPVSELAPGHQPDLFGAAPRPYRDPESQQ